MIIFMPMFLHSNSIIEFIILDLILKLCSAISECGMFEATHRHRTTSGPYIERAMPVNPKPFAVHGWIGETIA